MMGCYRPRPSTTAIIKTSKSPLPHRISNMSQDDGLQCDYAPFNLKASDDNAVDYLSTGNTHAPGLRKEFLDKFCTDLGYRNLSYLKDLCTTSAHTGFDTTDGCFNGKGFRTIKTTIVLLLQHIIDNNLREECAGCATDHPSQLQHSCLFEPAAYYFDSRFDELCRKLFKPNLQTIIDFTLRRYGLMTNNILRIQGTTGAILHELRDEPFIVAKLQEIREKLLDDSYKKVVYDAVDLWQSSASVPRV